MTAGAKDRVHGLPLRGSSQAKSAPGFVEKGRESVALVVWAARRGGRHAARRKSDAAPFPGLAGNSAAAPLAVLAMPGHLGAAKRVA
jgi:hypothetical protein